MFKKMTYFVLFILVLGLTQGQALGMHRAVYWDWRYWTSWTTDSRPLVDAFRTEGYEILDAGELKTWMDARIADGRPSVVVFCQDVAPDTVVETQDENCTLRRYLDAGGKIVWYSDIPLYYQGHIGGGSTSWGTGGSMSVLGFNAAGAGWDSNTQTALTTDGVAWGLTQTWASWRPTSPTITDNFRILATDGRGNAAAWVKHYVPGDTYRGFVRIWDRRGEPSFGDLRRVAEYAVNKASNPTPADGAIEENTWADLCWIPGTYAVSHDVYFGERYGQVNNGTGGTFQGNQTITCFAVGLPGHPYPNGLVPGKTYYWRIDDFDGSDTYKGDVWSFMVAPRTAYNPNPPDGAKFVDLKTVLSWSPGFGANKHYVYFGDNFDNVNNATNGTPQGTTTYKPGSLELEKVYYWRVDEFEGRNMHKGDVWSFTTARAGGGIKGEYFNNVSLSGIPVLTRLDPKIYFNWGLGSPNPLVHDDQFSVRWTGEVKAAFTETYTFCTRSDDGVRLWVDGRRLVNNWTEHAATDNMDTIDLVAGRKYSVVMEYYDIGGYAEAKLRWESPHTPMQPVPQAALSPPLRAYNPSPADGARGVTRTPTLQWTAGEEALRHDIYFGTNRTAVANANTTTPGIYRGRQVISRYTPPEELESGRTYYWRVDEINNQNSESPWVGKVWSFTALADPLARAVDTDLRFTTGGSVDWFSQTTTFYNDGDAAQSGDISDDQESWMQTTVSGKGTVKFYWLVSSEQDYDFLEFYIDGSLEEQISGLVDDWEQKVYMISTSGSHVLEWRYMKDWTTDEGSDCGWVDKVEWVTTP